MSPYPQEQSDRLDQSFVDYQTMQRVVAQWLDGATSLLTAADKLPRDQQTTEAQLEQWKVRPAMHVCGPGLPSVLIFRVDYHFLPRLPIL